MAIKGYGFISGSPAPLYQKLCRDERRKRPARGMTSKQYTHAADGDLQAGGRILGSSANNQARGGDRPWNASRWA